MKFEIKLFPKSIVLVEHIFEGSHVKVNTIGIKGKRFNGILKNIRNRLYNITNQLQRKLITNEKEKYFA